MIGLFEGPAPRVRAVPASAPFLDVFVDAMVDALWREDDPFALSDALVLLPNRRAAQGLIEAFARRLGGAALLPTIRPLGDLDEDADVWGADPIALDVAPPLSAAARRLELASLVRAKFRAEGAEDDPARAIALADEACKLLEAAAAAEKVDWSRLPHLVDEIDLAAHWRVSAQFLEIITRYWPTRLAAAGRSDPSQRRTDLLLKLADFWRAAPPQRPVLIAGSTGSVAATRALMAVVAHLPKGAVILPGLDSDLDQRAWDGVGPQHPQFALRETLRTLGLARADILPLGAETSQGRARRVLIREALVPADATADWLKRLDAAGGAKLAAQALEGLTSIEAANAEEEASVIALMMREALENPEASVALVTPDAALSRRVAAKLRRWGIAPAVSHARALRETEAGALMAVLCDLARDSGDPVALAGLMKHGYAAFGMAPDAFDHARRAIEREALRRGRAHGGVDDLAGRCETPAARALAARIAEALGPLIELPEETTLPTFADGVAAAMEAVAATPDAPGARIWAGRDGEAAARFIEELAAEGDAFGPMPRHAAPRALLALMRGRDAMLAEGDDPRCAIWGPLEARLQRRDLMILGGLNEGVWPAPPPEDAFLSRAMRARLGLSAPEARLGLAAHDFAQLASSPRVVLTRAAKRGGAPALASRWLWRLETLLRGADLHLPDGAAYLGLARRLDAPQAARPAPAPRPRPPIDARLRRLSVTEVETLIRDPYAVYARRILGLEALKPIGHAPGAAERGSAIHRAIERIGDDGDAAALRAALDRALAEEGFDAARRVAERARLEKSVRAWLDWADTREGAVLREAYGKLLLESGFMLTGRADRIELAPDGAVIVDVKTGAPPSDAQVAVGLNPQLTLEAAMLARGAFADAGARETKALVYFHFGAARPHARAVALKTPIMEAAFEALAALEALVARYGEAAQPFLSKPRVQFIKPYADYDLLARRKEWAEALTGDEA